MNYERIKDLIIEEFSGYQLIIYNPDINERVKYVSICDYLKRIDGKSYNEIKDLIIEDIDIDTDYKQIFCYVKSLNHSKT